MKVNRCALEGSIQRLGVIIGERRRGRMARRDETDKKPEA